LVGIASVIEAGRSGRLKLTCHGLAAPSLLASGALAISSELFLIHDREFT